MFPWLVLVIAMAGGPAWAGDDDEETRIDFYELAAPSPMKMRSMSATVGGAQDIGHLRDIVRHGLVPTPEAVTSAGLLGEHDLPGPATRCDRLLCPTGQAMPVDLVGQDDAVWLAQLGFTSRLDAATFERPPLDIVAVVDRSCSMTGEKFETVRASLSAVAAQLGPNDRMSIVTYGSDVTVELDGAGGDDATVDAAIRRLAIDGSTNMEAGLRTGYALARAHRRTFDGVTRVMLFTDEQPNVGRTDADGFMAMAEAASADGVGLTTIGVGIDFGDELARRVANVRGGNLFFFADVGEMQEKFAEEFDTLAVELAYDVEIVVRPSPGLRITGVYGVPGETFTWTEGGGLRTRVSTLFASREGGGIYFAFAPDGEARALAGHPVGLVTMRYDARDGGRTEASASFVLVEPGRASVGLTRGALLVDEYTALELASLRHAAGDTAGARDALRRIAERLSASRDPALEKELDLVRSLEQTLAGAGAVATRAPVDTGRIGGLPAR